MNTVAKNSEDAISSAGVVTALLVMQGAALNGGDEQAAMSYALTAALVATVILGSQMDGTPDEQLAFAQERLSELWVPISELVNEANGDSK